MLLRKVVCISVFVFVALAAPILPQCVPSQQAPVMLADGGVPAPPPIPWLTVTNQQVPVIWADGGEPAPPPIPWLTVTA